MKRYGLPRNNDVEHPDVADICYQKPGSKSRSRRIWKKKERREARKYCMIFFEERMDL
jgi:hypothetical protein